MAASTFVQRWEPATAGEALLHFLAKEVVEQKVRRQDLQDLMEDLPRGNSFAVFMYGCLVLHPFARLVQAAKHYRTLHIDDVPHANDLIRRYATEYLDITRSTCKNFDKLAPLAYEAAAKSSKASASTADFRVAIIREARGTVFCYSCGSMLDPNAQSEDEPDYMDIDHVWPHSLGGDTVLTNLIPACIPCNSMRKHLASWEWSLVQAPVLGRMGSKKLDDKKIGKPEKIALHTRAAMDFARKNGGTLKDAYQFIGARVSEGIELIDSSDTPDFFNLYTHDQIRSEITWEDLL